MGTFPLVSFGQYESPTRQKGEKEHLPSYGKNQKLRQCFQKENQKLPLKELKMQQAKKL